MSDTYKIKENSILARIAARKMKSEKMAMVVGRTIYLHNTPKEEFLQNRRWLRHELAHIRQFQALGVVGFLYQYLVESVRKGYYNNRFEVEAREAEHDYLIESQYVYQPGNKQQNKLT